MPAPYDYKSSPNSYESYQMNPFRQDSKHQLPPLRPNAIEVMQKLGQYAQQPIPPMPPSIYPPAQQNISTDIKIIKNKRMQIIKLMDELEELQRSNIEEHKYMRKMLILMREISKFQKELMQEAENLHNQKFHNCCCSN